MQDILAPMVLENLECSGMEARLVDCPRISAEAAAGNDYASFTLRTRCDPLRANYALVACGTTSGPRAPSMHGCVYILVLLRRSCLGRVHGRCESGLPAQAAGACRSSSGLLFASQGNHVNIECYTEKATEARHGLERQYNACANRKKQCRPNETKPYSNATHPRKRQNDPTNVHTPSRIMNTECDRMVSHHMHAMETGVSGTENGPLYMWPPYCSFTVCQGPKSRKYNLSAEPSLRVTAVHLV